MSGSKKRRAARNRVAGRPRPDASEPAKGTKRQRRDPRIQEARRRASLAKRGLGGLGIVAFGAAMVLARTTMPSRPRQPVRPLTAPPRFVDIVRQNLLQAGLVGPASAPPGAATGVS